MGHAGPCGPRAKLGAPLLEAQSVKKNNFSCGYNNTTIQMY